MLMIHKKSDLSELSQNPQISAHFGDRKLCFVFKRNFNINKKYIQATMVLQALLSNIKPIQKLIQ